jgi:hypothetical protein
MSAQSNGTKNKPQMFREGTKQVQAKQQPVDLMKAMNITSKVTTA